MKNSFLILYFFSILTSVLFAESVQIQSKNITLDKNKEFSIFEKDVVIITEQEDTIKSDYAEYRKKEGIIKLEKNIIATDKENNRITTNFAQYNEIEKIFISQGQTEILTSEKYLIVGSDIILNNKTHIIKSDKEAKITDQDNNTVYLQNFEYHTKSNIFKSLGFAKIKDNRENIYEFSQIYIDTEKKEILGTDVKAFMNDENFKINEKNKPRIFANTLKIDNKINSFNKSIFTLCDYRENDKCPPWTIQASKMLHDNNKKTIYYDNAIVKIYDIPIFYLPKLSHPDPTVDRRSGFLAPAFSNSKNLGSGLSIPYFWAIDKDKNFTLTNKIYVDENPLFLGEYHQAFKNSNLLTDFGYTKGYKKSSNTKKAGDKSHFFSKYVKNFKPSPNSESTLSVSLQDVSNDKYLKLYKIESDLVDYNETVLENSIGFTHENDNLFFGFSSSVYETLNENYNDKYEYILPEITLDRNLINSDKIGKLDLQTNYKFHNYDTNKSTNFLINNFEWEANSKNYLSGINGTLLGNFKNINYEVKNEDLYKKDTTSEIFGALGYLSEINLRKEINESLQLLKPKMLIRYSPGSMRKETDGFLLDPEKAFSMDRLENNNNFETGFTGAVGLDYNYKKKGKEFDFSLAQIINSKENKKMASKTSLDEKLSDVVGSAKYNISERINLNYNFSIDQNYNQLNYNEIGSEINFDPFQLNFNYLKESEHIGDQEYFQTKLNLGDNEKGIFSFETKRNLVTDSSEFYNLSYEYINDCLRAGLVYRREFYVDSEIEPENSLMFKITLTPFGNINSPSFAE